MPTASISKGQLNTRVRTRPPPPFRSTKLPITGKLIHEFSRVCANCACFAGGGSRRVGGADGRPGGPRSEDRRWRGFQPSTGAAALNAGFIPDAEAPTLAIIPEPALAVRPGLQVLTGAQIPPESAPAVRPLVHDEAHAPLSALPQSSPVRWGNVPDCLRTLPQPGPLGGVALLWCRRGALGAPGVQNGGD